MSEDTYTIDDVSSLTGVPVRKLQRWDETGFARASSRTGGGHRRYTEDDVLRIRLAAALRRLRISAKRARPMLDAVEEIVREVVKSDTRAGSMTSCPDDLLRKSVTYTGSMTCRYG